MKTLKFAFRFFNFNKLHNQFEYAVESVGLNQPQANPFFMGVSRDFKTVNKISNPQDTAPSVEYVVAKITDEAGRKSFEQAFLEAIRVGFDEFNRACFDFEISQSEQNKSEFKFVKVTDVFTRYTKEVNGGPYTKLFSTDLGAVIADGKFCWINNLIDIDEDVVPATQLNVDRLWDEEDQQKLYYIEFDYEQHWYDATTWSSGEAVAPFFSPNYSIYKEKIAELQLDIDVNFESEWESVYTLDGEIVNRFDYENPNEEF